MFVTCVTPPSRPRKRPSTCKGSCGKHLHRYCASVSKYHYLELKNSSSPFVCLICTQQLHTADVQSVIAALKDELNEFRTALPCLLKQAAPVVASPSMEDIVQELKKDVEKLQSTNCDKQSNGHCRNQSRERTLGEPGTAIPTPESSGTADTGKHKIQVVGACRI